MNVTVFGAGTMGNGIAHVFALKGHKVNLCDTDNARLDHGIDNISKNLNRQISKGHISQENANKTLNIIKTGTHAATMLEGAELVVEAVNEQFEVKAEIFNLADEFTDAKTILASNTSSISISKLAAETRRADKVIGMHFMNPVPLMQLVEVIKGKETSEATTITIVELSKKLDKIPVVVNDFPGFVSNRVLMPMINEAIYCVYEEVADVAAIDEIMKLGMAHPMGPLQLADYIGLDVCLSIMQVLQQGFSDAKYKPCPLLSERVEQGKLGVKSGEGFYTWMHGKLQKPVNFIGRK
ncbi:MAG: 3-hydroxyacyl-CoA dehydrogenase family protein [Cyclobacteriaceae bacterium]